MPYKINQLVTTKINMTGENELLFHWKYYVQVFWSANKINNKNSSNKLQISQTFRDKPRAVVKQNKLGVFENKQKTITRDTECVYLGVAMKINYNL